MQQASLTLSLPTTLRIRVCCHEDAGNADIVDFQELPGTLDYSELHLSTPFESASFQAVPNAFAWLTGGYHLPSPHF